MDFDRWCEVTCFHNPLHTLWFGFRIELVSHSRPLSCNDVYIQGNFPGSVSVELSLSCEVCRRACF